MSPQNRVLKPNPQCDSVEGEPFGRELGLDEVMGVESPWMGVVTSEGDRETRVLAPLHPLPKYPAM